MAWEIDAFHSLVEFSVRHLHINTVKGRFNGVHGSLHIDPKHPENSSVKAQVQVANIDTGVPQRDAHLRSADFFDAIKYPTISFESTEVKTIDDTHCYVLGMLSLHGTTRPVTFNVIYTGYVRDPMTEAWRVGLCAVTMIDRRDFGVLLSQQQNTDILLISNEVRIEIYLEALLV